jgi:hypothetical protein
VDVDSPHTTPVDPDELVTRTRPHNAGLSWPIAVDEHLDRLVARATDSGERTFRKELIAAIIAATDVDGAELGNLLRSYRTKRVKELLGADARDGVIEIAQRRPGRRTRQ